MSMGYAPPAHSESEASKRPETLGQAVRWETVKNRYGRRGLRVRCAAQAAWGHQLGFGNVHPPCGVCESVVVGFEVAERNGWRRFRRG